MFFTDPNYQVDLRLTLYTTRSAFAHLAAETRRNCAGDCCLFFNFLWQRDKNWCSDYTHSPFGEQGVPCRGVVPALHGLPNAVITPRHPTRLAYLLHVLKELRSALSPEVWTQDWREPSALLRDLRKAPTSDTGRTGPRQRTQAAGRTEENQRATGRAD